MFDQIIAGKISSGDRRHRMTVTGADWADLMVNWLRELLYLWSVRELLVANGMEDSEAKRIAETLGAGKWTHDYPIALEEIQKLGLPVHDDMPKEVYALMDLYPQAGGRRPSVGYIPAPYQPRERKEPGKGERE